MLNCEDGFPHLKTTIKWKMVEMPADMGLCEVCHIQGPSLLCTPSVAYAVEFNSHSNKWQPLREEAERGKWNACKVILRGF